MKNLKVLALEGYKKFKDMLMELKHLASLHKISFKNYKKMKIDGNTFNIFTRLTFLVKVEVIYNGFVNLTLLEKLFFIDCTNLKKFYATFDGMTNLKVLWFKGYEIIEDMLMRLKHFSSL